MPRCARCCCKAGELTPIEKAERRVLVLANPGHGLENMKASPAMYLGMQLLLPGEWAPSHRHTPNAVRMIVEGEGAYTTVDGEKCPMSRGDLILTPTGLWHEHGHDGTEPGGVARRAGPAAGLLHGGQLPRQRHAPGRQARPAATAPTPAPAWCPRRCSAQRKRLPDAALPLGRGARRAAGAGRRPARSWTAVQVTYVNPETGDDAENILGFYALMLRPARRCALPARSPAQVFHLIEGGATWPPAARPSRWPRPTPAAPRATAGDADQPLGRPSRPSCSWPTNRRCTASWACTNRG
jgi:gentisate 1,2-dioxygenase